MKQQRNPALPGNLKNLKLRQRKKMRVGEFQELGFSLQAQFVAGLEVATQDALLDDWLTTVDQAGVSFGGQFDAQGMLEGLVFPVAQVKVTEALRSSLLDWLKNRSEVAGIEASALFDLWHTA